MKRLILAFITLFMTVSLGLFVGEVKSNVKLNYQYMSRSSIEATYTITRDASFNYSLGCIKHPMSDDYIVEKNRWVAARVYEAGNEFVAHLIKYNEHKNFECDAIITLWYEGDVKAFKEYDYDTSYGKLNEIKIFFPKFFSNEIRNLFIKYEYKSLETCKPCDDCSTPIPDLGNKLMVGHFRIESKQIWSIDVLKPNSSTIWEKGKLVAITWETNIPNDDTKIELYRNSAYYSQITSGTSQQGYYDFVLSSSLSNGSNYQIKLTSNKYPSVSTYSNYFTISSEALNQGPAVIITSHKNQEEVSTKKVTIKGIADDSDGVNSVSLRICDENLSWCSNWYSVTVSETDNWEKSISLDSGRNVIQVKAEDRFGKETDDEQIASIVIDCKPIYRISGNIFDSDENLIKDATVIFTGESSFPDLSSVKTVDGYYDKTEVLTGWSGKITAIANGYKNFDIVSIRGIAQDFSGFDIYGEKIFINTPPTSNAGPDQTVVIPIDKTEINVTLDGSKSSDPDYKDDIVTYQWTATTGTPDPDDIVNPIVSLSKGKYTFALSVKDKNDEWSEKSDTVKITVKEAPPVIELKHGENIITHNSTYDAGDYKQDSTHSLIITAKNTGKADLVIKNFSISHASNIFYFDPQPADITIEADKSHNFIIKFKPNSFKTYSGNISFETNTDNSPFGFKLTADAKPKLILISVVKDISTPMIDNSDTHKISVLPGDDITFKAKVKNIGNPVPSFKVRFVLSKNEEFSDNDPKIGDFSIEALSSGAESQEVSMPYRLHEPGIYYIGLKIDIDDLHKDSDFSSTKKIIVRPPQVPLKDEYKIGVVYQYENEDGHKPWDQVAADLDNIIEAISSDQNTNKEGNGRKAQIVIQSDISWKNTHSGSSIFKWGDVKEFAKIIKNKNLKWSPNLAFHHNPNWVELENSGEIDESDENKTYRDNDRVFDHEGYLLEGNHLTMSPSSRIWDREVREWTDELLKEINCENYLDDIIEDIFIGNEVCYPANKYGPYDNRSKERWKEIYGKTYGDKIPSPDDIKNNDSKKIAYWEFRSMELGRMISALVQNVRVKLYELGHHQVSVSAKMPAYHIGGRNLELSSYQRLPGFLTAINDEIDFVALDIYEREEKFFNLALESKNTIDPDKKNQLYIAEFNYSYDVKSEPYEDEPDKTTEIFFNLIKEGIDKFQAHGFTFYAWGSLPPDDISNSSNNGAAKRKSLEKAFAWITNDPPIITYPIIQPIIDSIENLFDIIWTDEDANSNALVALYYDTDRVGRDGTLIAANISEDDELDSYRWDTSEVPAGEYYIYAKIDDGISEPVFAYSSVPVTVVKEEAKPKFGIVTFKTNLIRVYEHQSYIQIAINRIDGDDGSVSVDYVCEPESAEIHKDFEPVSGTIEWNDGDSNTKTISIPINNDSIDEWSESFTVIIKEPNGGVTIGNNNSIQVIIKDNEYEPWIVSNGGEVLKNDAYILHPIVGEPFVQSHMQNSNFHSTAGFIFQETLESKIYLKISDAKGFPGQNSITIPVELDNQTELSTPVSSLECHIQYNPSDGIQPIENIHLTSRTQDFTEIIQIKENAANSEMVILLYNLDGKTILPGLEPIFNIMIHVDIAAFDNSSSILKFSKCIASDLYTNPINIDHSDVGLIQILSHGNGNIDADPTINILDVHFVINVILDREQRPAIIQRADSNKDCMVDVLDLQCLINKIIGIECTIINSCNSQNRRLKANDSIANVISFPHKRLFQNKQGTIGVSLKNIDIIGSGQFRFTYDSNIGLNITKVNITNRTTDFQTSFTQKCIDGSLNEVLVLFYSLAGKNINTGEGNILEFEYTTNEKTGKTDVVFSEIILADTSATSLLFEAHNGSVDIQQAKFLNDVILLLKFLSGMNLTDVDAERLQVLNKNNSIPELSSLILILKDISLQ